MKIAPFDAFREIIGVYIINRILHGRLEIRNFSSRVEKLFTSERSEQVKYFSTLVEKFRISARPCNKDLQILGRGRERVRILTVCF